ncbi:MAG: hypothetical protein JRF30_12400 [Deltaproteobacteria bacterium]|nr:hypothetical protein [Deltaproteobacteria bacterium]
MGRQEGMRLCVLNCCWDMIQASSVPRRVRIDAPEALNHILGVGGYDFSKAVNRVAGLFDMKTREILLPGKQAQRVKARSLLCYWAAKELGISSTSVANKLGMHQSSVSRAAPASGH